MQPHKIVSREEWIEARKAHMAREKELTRAREALSEERRNLPWVKVDKDYVFDGPNGKMTLADLFKGRPQLVGRRWRIQFRQRRLQSGGAAYRFAPAAGSGPVHGLARVRVQPVP